LDNIDHVHEKVLVSALLFASLGKGSEKVDTFSNWLLAGFAAAVSFLLANIGSLASHVPSKTLQELVTAFLIVFALGLVEKMLAVVVAAASAGSAIGREMGDKIAATGTEVDIAYLLSEIERAVFPPIRRLVRRSFAKAQSGDLTAAARAYSHCVEAQIFLVLIQGGAVLWSVWLLARNVKF
jgi:hypothetical protein